MPNQVTFTDEELDLLRDALDEYVSNMDRNTDHPHTWFNQDRAVLMNVMESINEALCHD